MTTTLQPDTAADHAPSVSRSPTEPAPEIELAERRKVYRWFVRGTFLFAVHVLAVLLVLGYIFSGSFG